MAKMKGDVWAKLIATEWPNCYEDEGQERIMAGEFDLTFLAKKKILWRN